MKTRRLDFTDIKLYAVTPDIFDATTILNTIEGLLKGGVDAVQLRTQKLTDRDFFSLGLKIQALCRTYDALFLVNNRADLALALQADGIHIGHTDLPIPFVREMMGYRRLVGVSTHSLPEALDAQRKGADYVSCGPLWLTPTKPDYKAVGLNLIGFYRAALKIPFTAIGGIDATNIDEVIQAGVSCVAVVRALFGSSDPEMTAREFKEKFAVANDRVSV